MNLTKNEITILKACLNYDNREDQLDDNYSNGSLNEFRAQLPEMNDQAIGGVLSSLEKKGALYIYEDEVNFETYTAYSLSEDGINAIFDHLEG